MKILITGGAGYIGSHVVKQLLELTSHDVIVIDNLSTGFQKTIDILQNIRKFEFINLDLKEFDKVEEIFKKYDIETVIHFAAFSQVGESMQNPMKYYINNTVNTTNLVKLASQFGAKKFVFSSTAAVYGEPKLEVDELIMENTQTNPINPYGQSKLMSEKVIIDEAKVNSDFKYVIFRYFNVAGADMNLDNEIIDPRIGECHDPETHLIPLVVKTALKKRDTITIFGDDYDTPDGTCIRDYIHVEDLADAHIEAIEYLDNQSSDIFNCGYGKGYSVKEIIQNVKDTTNINFNVNNGDKREGDPSILVSNNDKIKNSMNWKPKYDNLDLIIHSAFNWEKHID